MPLIKGLVYKMISQNHKTKINYGRFINTLKVKILNKSEGPFSEILWPRWREILFRSNLCGEIWINVESAFFMRLFLKNMSHK